METPRNLTIKWLEKAILEFDAALEFLAEKNPVAAKDLAKAVTNAVDLLPLNTLSGRPGRVKGTRELVIVRYQYIVPFRVVGEEIQILRVFHTKRKPPRKW